MAAKVGQGAASPQGLQSSPQCLPAHGSTQTGSAARQLPAASQRPASDGIRQGGVADRQGGSTVQASPQRFPSQGAGVAPGHCTVLALTHAPAASHAFTSAVSTQPATPGSQAVHAAPQTFPAQGS
jgi:hypothetical protein